MITAQFSINKISSNSSEAFSLYEKSRFGEKKRGKIDYSLIESLYLLQNNKIQIFSGKKQLSFDEALKKTKKLDKRIEIKLPIYGNMRKNGRDVGRARRFLGQRIMRKERKNIMF